MSADAVSVRGPDRADDVDDGPPREVPELTPITEPFWTAGKHGQLKILRCRSCRHWIHPPSSMCPSCHSLEVGYEATSGRGRILSYTVNHRAWRPDLPVPYVIAIVELVEQTGLRLTTNLVGCPPEAAAIDLPVKVRFLAQPPYYIPLFEPDTEEGSA